MNQQRCTASALAYITVPYLQEPLKQARQRRLDYLKCGDKRKAIARTDHQTVTDLAAAKGVSRSLVFMAQAMHKTFAEHPKLKEEYEPQILSGAVGLAKVKRAIERRFQENAAATAGDASYYPPITKRLLEEACLFLRAREPEPPARG